MNLLFFDRRMFMLTECKKQRAGGHRWQDSAVGNWIKKVGKAEKDGERRSNINAEAI